MINVNTEKDAFRQVNLAMEKETSNQNIQQSLNKINYLYQNSVKKGLMSYEMFFKYQLSKYYIYFDDKKGTINIECGEKPLNTHQYLFMPFDYNKTYLNKFRDLFISFFKKEKSIKEVSDVIKQYYSKLILQIQTKFFKLMSDSKGNIKNLMIHVTNHQIPFYNVDDEFLVTTLTYYFRNEFSNKFNENFLLSKMDLIGLDIIFHKYIQHGLVHIEHAGDDGSFDISTIFRYLNENNRSKLLKKFANINKFTRSMFDYCFDNDYIKNSFSEEEKKNVLTFIINKMSYEKMLTDQLFYGFLTSLTDQNIYVNVTSLYNLINSNMKFTYIIKNSFFSDISVENIMNYSERGHNYTKYIKDGLESIVKNKQSVIIENYYNIKEKITNIKSIINLFPNYDLDSEIYNNIISIEKNIIKLSTVNDKECLLNMSKLIINKSDSYYYEEYNYNPLSYIPMKTVSY